MGRKVTMINELVNVAYKFYRLLNYRFPRKVHAVRIPPCGDFQRKEDNEIRNTLIRLCKNGNSSRVKTLILHGPAGHGKIYSAANLMDQLYSKPLRSRYFWNKPWNFRNRPTILWTINAKNEATMLESYCSLAKEIGLTEEAKVANQELSLLSRTSEGRQYHINLQNQCQENAYDEALKQIYEEVMKKLKHEGSWVLLIEDPKEDRSSRQQFWPQSGDPSFGNGLVIMTTESQKLRPEEDDYPLAKVSIDKMTKEDAVRFFGKKSGIRLTGVDLKNAEFIAVKLANRIPQDIAKVAAFVREYKEETNKQLAFPGLPVPTEKTLFGYMMILELTRQNQTQLLKFLACCSSENYLPLEILKRGIEGAVEAVKDSKYVDESTRNEIKVVTIHPRDHATLRDILSRQQSNDTEQTWKYFSKLPFFNEQRNINIAPLSCLDVSQVIACLSKVCKDALQRNRDKDFVLLRLILPHLKEAVQLSNKMKLEGEFEPHVMAIGHACLGEGLLIFGESEEARGNLETALNLFQNCRDEENVHLDVANVKHFLGEAFSNSHLGDPLQGISYLENALEEKERFYNGKEDPQIALTLQSLGNVLNELGKHCEAIFHIERALKIYRDSENFKQEYGFTISALGSSYRYLGQYSKAEDKLKKALKIFESVESPSELRIGVTLSRLSSVERNMDKLDESIVSLEKALKKLGHNHIYSAVILSKMSVVYRYKGDLKKSVKFAEEAKTISDGQHGTKSHPAIATALLNLGHAQSDVGDIDDAVRNIEKALDIYQALHGKNHRIVAATLNYLGYAYQQKGMMQEGKKELERAVEIMEHYSPIHPEKANSLKRLSKACLILGETVRSADLAHRALKIYKETYGNTMQHREVRKCAVRVAYPCSKLGLFEEAAEYLREVELGFPAEKRSLPEFAAFLRKKTEITLDSFEFNWPLDEAAVQGIFSKANTDLIKADEIVCNSLGRKHRQFALTKKERARLNIFMGNHKDAYDEILSALKIDPQSCNYLTADLYLIKSDAEKELNLTDAQKECLQTAKNIYRNVFGDHHPMVAFTLQKLCTTYLDLAQKRSRCKKEGHKYFEASERACEVLQNNLEQQLPGTQTDFLRNYSVDKHPILKRQQLLAKRIRDDQGAW